MCWELPFLRGVGKLHVACRTLQRAYYCTYVFCCGLSMQMAEKARAHFEVLVLQLSSFNS